MPKSIKWNQICRMLLFLLFVTHLAACLKIQCTQTDCVIGEYSSNADSFVYRYFPSSIREVTYEKLLIENVDATFLSEVASVVHHVKVEHSNRLKRMKVPNAVLHSLLILSTRLHFISLVENQSLTDLTISSAKLTRVPPTIKNVLALRNVTFMICKIRTVDLADFCDHSLLVKLDLNSNHIRYVVNTVTRHCSLYDSLKSLLLYSNLLTTINLNMFSAFPQLSYLTLRNNKIKTLTHTFRHSALENINLGINGLEKANLCDWSVPNLSRLSFRRNQLKKLPSCITIFTNLTVLSVAGNGLANFSIESLVGLDKLQELELEMNSLTSAVLTSDHFPKDLQTIDLSMNNLTEIDLSYIPVHSLRVILQSNAIERFDLNNTSPNVTALEMAYNPIDCSFSTPLERAMKHVDCGKKKRI